MWEPEQSWEALFFYSSSLFNPHSAGPAEISVALHAAECRSGLQGSERQRCNNATVSQGHGHHGCLWGNSNHR